LLKTFKSKFRNFVAASDIVNETASSPGCDMVVKMRLFTLLLVVKLEMLDRASELYTARYDVMRHRAFLDQSESYPHVLK
jgi:hypothetical protein